jgi:hypothetical protein
MKIFSSLLLVVILAMSCKKDISIIGFTMTDALGNVMSAEDPGDWTFDDSWKQKETDIFDDIASGNLSGSSAGTITMYPAFPNPCTNYFNLHINSSTKCVMRIAIVNKDRNKLASDAVAVNSGGNTYSLPVSGEDFKSGTLYRVYYVFDAEGHMMFKKGHGDIMIQ